MVNLKNILIGLVPLAGALLLIRSDSVRPHIFLSIVMLATRQITEDIIQLNSKYTQEGEANGTKDN